jgi:hypothetical protein
MDASFARRFPAPGVLLLPLQTPATGESIAGGGILPLADESARLCAGEGTICFAPRDFASKQFLKEVDWPHCWYIHMLARVPRPLLQFSGVVLYSHDA